MKTNLIRKELKEIKLVLVVSLAFLVFTAFLIQFTYPLMKELTRQPIPESPFIPKDLSQQLLTLSNYRVYIWSQWFPKNLIQVLVIVALILGASALAGEKSRKTWEFLLARPFSRKEVFLYKVMSRLTATFGLSFFSTTFYWLILGAFKPSVFSLWPGFLLANLAVFSLAALVFSVALFFSAFSNRPLYAGGFSFFVILLFSVISPLVEKKLPDYLRVSSLTAYRIFSNFDFPFRIFLIVLLLAVVFQVAALLFWEKQDLV